MIIRFFIQVVTNYEPSLDADAMSPDDESSAPGLSFYRVPIPFGPKEHCCGIRSPAADHLSRAYEGIVRSMKSRFPALSKFLQEQSHM